MRHYSVYRFWSATFDAMAARVSVTDAHGGELFAILPVSVGRIARQTVVGAADILLDHAAAGREPGEVTITPDQALDRGRELEPKAA